MQILGVEQTKKAILAQGEAYVEALKAAQIKMGVIIMTKARALAPRDTGGLMRAGYVRASKKPSATGSLVSIGFRAPHAAAQHKGVVTKTTKSGRSYTVRYRPDSGGPLFLRKAFDSMKGGYVELMATLIKSFVANKVTQATVSNPYPYKLAKRSPRKR